MDSIKNHWQEGILAKHSWNPPNTTEYWAGMDTEENFKKNPHPDYTETSITYTYNSQGFRTQEFNLDHSDNIILCFGCSHTQGIGVQTPWPEILQQQLLNYKIYNLGHASGSRDTVARLITNYVPILKPKKVCILWPGLLRYELYDNLGVKYIGSWHNNKPAVENLTKENTINWAEKNKVYIKLFSKVYSFELYEQDSDTFTHRPLDRGRDNAHLGSKTQTLIAKNFLSQILC